MKEPNEAKRMHSSASWGKMSSISHSSLSETTLTEYNVHASKKVFRLILSMRLGVVLSFTVFMIIIAVTSTYVSIDAGMDSVHSLSVNIIEGIVEKIEEQFITHVISLQSAVGLLHRIIDTSFPNTTYSSNSLQEPFNEIFQFQQSLPNVTILGVSTNSSLDCPTGCLAGTTTVKNQVYAFMVTPEDPNYFSLQPITFNGEGKAGVTDVTLTRYGPEQPLNEREVWVAAATPIEQNPALREEVVFQKPYVSLFDSSIRILGTTALVNTTTDTTMGFIFAEFSLEDLLNSLASDDDVTFFQENQGEYDICVFTEDGLVIHCVCTSTACPDQFQNETAILNVNENRTLIGDVYLSALENVGGFDELEESERTKITEVDIGFKRFVGLRVLEELNAGFVVMVSLSDSSLFKDIRRARSTSILIAVLVGCVGIFFWSMLIFFATKPFLTHMKDEVERNTALMKEKHKLQRKLQQETVVDRLDTNAESLIDLTTETPLTRALQKLRVMLANNPSKEIEELIDLLKNANKLQTVEWRDQLKGVVAQSSSRLGHDSTGRLKHGGVSSRGVLQERHKNIYDDETTKWLEQTFSTGTKGEGSKAVGKSQRSGMTLRTGGSGLASSRLSSGRIKPILKQGPSQPQGLTTAQSTLFSSTKVTPVGGAALSQSPSMPSKKKNVSYKDFPSQKPSYNIQDENEEEKRGGRSGSPRRVEPLGGQPQRQSSPAISTFKTPLYTPSPLQNESSQNLLPSALSKKSSEDQLLDEVTAETGDLADNLKKERVDRGSQPTEMGVLMESDSTLWDNFDQPEDSTPVPPQGDRFNLKTAISRELSPKDNEIKVLFSEANADEKGLGSSSDAHFSSAEEPSALQGAQDQSHEPNAAPRPLPLHLTGPGRDAERLHLPGIPSEVDLEGEEMDSTQAIINSLSSPPVEEEEKEHEKEGLSFAAVAPPTQQTPIKSPTPKKDDSRKPVRRMSTSSPTPSDPLLGRENVPPSNDELMKRYRKESIIEQMMDADSISELLRVAEGIESYADGTVNPFKRYIPRGMETDLHARLANWDARDFSLFDLDRDTNGHGLAVLTLHLLSFFDLPDTISLDIPRLCCFLEEIESRYHVNPYHNRVHAAEVLGLSMMLVHESQLFQIFSPLDLLSLMVAAIGHDVDHPGVNNMFLINTNHRLALRYNDISVLENHHAATLFNVLAKPQCNFLRELSTEIRKDLRDFVVFCILGTDMTHHFNLVGEFTTRAEEQNLADCVDSGLEFEDRKLYGRMALKLSDVGHAFKKIGLTVEWTRKINKEFFAQGDREQAVGLPVSQFMDRSTMNIPKSQIGFFDFVVRPLVKAWCMAVDNFHTLESLNRNREYWVRLYDRGLLDCPETE